MHTMQSISTRQLTIWIACFAILMNALAPSISHARASTRGIAATWEICRTDTSAVSLAGKGDLVVAGAAAVSPAKNGAPPNTGPMADCGYCLPHPGSDSLMPSAITGVGIFGGHALRPFLFYRAPQPLLALSAVPARGPPALA
jgi:Protein of unknown function (DUF2946)